jgi:hypothetical protein
VDNTDESARIHRDRCCVTDAGRRHDGGGHGRKKSTAGKNPSCFFIRQKTLRTIGSVF